MEVAFEVKLEKKPCGKESFGGKLRMTVYNWINVKLLYYSIIKQACQCFLQLFQIAKIGSKLGKSD